MTVHLPMSPLTAQMPLGLTAWLTARVSAEHESWTHERELTDAVDLCTPDGAALNPAAVGWSRHPLHRANLRGNSMRTKKWDYWAIVSDEVAVGIVYADIGYLGLANLWWGDLNSGATGGAELVRPLGKGISLPDVPGTSPLRVDDPGLSMTLTDDEHGTRLWAAWTEKDGTAGELDVNVAMPAGHESLSVVIPWSSQRFQYTIKDQARPVTGVLRVGNKVTAFGDALPAWGVLDVGRGRWPYSIRWNWAGGAGIADSGEVIGLQMGAKWTAGTGVTENAVTVDGRLYKLGQELDWDYDWNSPMRPWRVRDRRGILDVELTPRLDKHGATNAGVLRTEVHQVFGDWSGRFVTPDGEEVLFQRLAGFAEESRNRW